MNRPCPFSSTTLQFTGTPVEQAQCLLRRVRLGGNVDDPPAQLPETLLNRVGKPVDFTRSQLEAYLTLQGIAARDIGGALNAGVSTNSRGTKALYFAIHDTSDSLSGSAFPPNINEASWRNNDLARRDISPAHVFINRLGQSATGHNYSVGHRATKRERGFNNALKGLFLHHELIQPRIKGGHSFHAVAPQPGFTAATLDRLALCYLAASLRRGMWMIPAFHCVLDLGIPDGHDDPQNFDLFQWAGAIEKILAEVKAPQPSPVAMADAAGDRPELETVRSDLSDGQRRVKLQRVRNTTALFFKAKMSIDADGAARAYHPDDIPEALDRLVHATSHSKKFIQGKRKNGVVGKGPRPGFHVSATALQRGEDHDANSFVDAEFIPYIVLPSDFASGVRKGDLCTVVNLKNNRTTAAIFADVNPRVGEASVRAAINLRVQDSAFPITELAKRGGDNGDNYVYIVYPGSRFTAQAAVPHWPVEKIEETANALFAEWGGLDMVRRIFA
jgi:Fungal chitosanase of glycosyl hydrolase group 75